MARRILFYQYSLTPCNSSTGMPIVANIEKLYSLKKQVITIYEKLYSSGIITCLK